MSGAGAFRHAGRRAARDWRALAPAALLILAAAVPVIYIAVRVIVAGRNVPFWDEFGTVLGFVIDLDRDPTGWQFIRRLGELDSGHRTVASRLIVAAMYGLTGHVNFNLLSAIGNLALAGACGLAVAAVDTVERRLRLGALLALGLYHLQHYEPFLWSGASIDHFLAILMATAALCALGRPGRRALAVAAGFGVLATFTLAHGCLVWPVGAGLLWAAGRRRALLVWGGVALGALAAFFTGYHIPEMHRLHDLSAAGVGRLLEFWLALLGGPLTFGVRAYAPIGGGLLVSALAWAFAGGGARRQPVIAGLALFAVGSLALIAIGRLEVSSSQIQSRYLVLGSLAWALTGFLLIERYTAPERPYRLIGWCLPGLVAFNIAADVHAQPAADLFLWSRDYSTVRFKQYGEEGHAGPFRLHPGKDTSRVILGWAAERGIYQLPAFCRPVAAPSSVTSPEMVTYVTDVTVNQAAVGFEGWAMLPNRESRRGEIHVALRSEQSFIVLSTLGASRPDVATAFKEPRWRNCGYNFVLPRASLPSEDFQIGLMIVDGVHSRIKMTDHWLKLAAK